MSKICIVVPCYNEEERLDLEAYTSFLSTNANYSILFVNDGSTDGTINLLHKFSSRHDQVDVLDLANNGGKAEAVRMGILSACKDQSHEFVGFLDADLATPLHEIIAFEKTLRHRPDSRLALGSRWKRLGAQIDRKIMRHYLGRIFATVTSMLFQFSIYDTQCGAKLMRNINLSEIFSEPFISAWFFDIEIICRYQNQQGDLDIDDWAIEIPLNTWREVGGSRIKIWDFLLAPLALLKIRSHYRK